MKRSRRVKILATLGPSSFEEHMIEALFRAGADVFRINMSHTDQELMADIIARIRRVEDKVGRPIGVLVDLQGPKLRIGAFAEESITLEEGQPFRLDDDQSPGDATRVELPHPEIIAAIEPGHHLLLDDGKVELKAMAVDAGHIDTVVVYGGKLSSRKGVSLPDTILPSGALTPKDRSDLDAALRQSVDWIALSFVQRPEDVMEIRKAVQGRTGVMAKIEKPQAIERLEEIVRLCDAIMIARGDLGVEMPLEQVPGLQKRMIRLARRKGKPVVVATQMLESMITSPVPTRAEVSDVSIAVFEGADAVMLSAESAIGHYPVKAVKMMDKVAIAVESDSQYSTTMRAQATEPEATSADAISAATRQVAETLNLAAIVTFTHSGSTGFRASRERPNKPILACSPITETVRRLSLVWGLHCVQVNDAHNIEEMVGLACATARDNGFARPGDSIAISAGVPFGSPGTTNMLRIAYVQSPDREG